MVSRIVCVIKKVICLYKNGATYKPVSYQRACCIGFNHRFAYHGFNEFWIKMSFASMLEFTQASYTFQYKCISSCNAEAAGSALTYHQK